jgi:hypothetical protein
VSSTCGLQAAGAAAVRLAAEAQRSQITAQPASDAYPLSSFSPASSHRYGPKQQPPIYTYYDGDANLFGARKPHLPQEFSLEEGELITRVELQWDPISMRCVCIDRVAPSFVESGCGCGAVTRTALQQAVMRL